MTICVALSACIAAHHTLNRVVAGGMEIMVII